MTVGWACNDRLLLCTFRPSLLRSGEARWCIDHSRGILGSIANGWHNTVAFAKRHANVIGTAVGFGLGLGCMAFTMGMGALGCGGIASAVGNGLTAGLEGKGVGGVLKASLVGFGTGLLGAGFGNIGGAVLGKAMTGSLKEMIPAGIQSGKDLVDQGARQVFTRGGTTGMAEMHASLLSRLPSSIASTGVYGGMVKEGLPTMVGSAVVSGFAPSSVSGIGQFNVVNAASGFLTGWG